jgi:glucosamine--fructose-6-phosphate aminotransferase (isomerizing)
MSIKLETSPQDLARQAGRTRMHNEAAEASAIVAAQFRSNNDLARRLGRELRETPPRLVVTCGRGSSDHAATYAKYLIETRLGVTTTSAAPSLSSIYAESNGAPDVLFIAVSQSGKSPDLLSATTLAHQAGAMIVAVVNVEDSPLALLADAVLPIKAGPELSVAATKSYLGSLAAVLQLVAHWSDLAELKADLDRVPDLLAQSWALDWSAGVEALKDARSLYVLGRGVGLGAAQEMALKFKETCGIHAEAFSSAEVRHGPMAIVEQGFPVLMIGQDDETLDGVVEIARELTARGAKVICAGFSVEGAITLPSLKTASALQPLMLVQSFYRMTNMIAIARGLDPDTPPHLAKVTETL